MKKNVIALLLAVVMASGSVGAVPVLATETTAEEAVAVEEESVDEQKEAAEIMEDSDFGLTDEDVLEEESAQTEEEPVKGDEEKADETVLADEQEASVDTAETTEVALDDEKETTESIDEGDSSTEIAESEETDVIEEEIVVAEENKSVQEGDAVDSGQCGDDATWTLTGTDDNLTLTISGTGKMYNYDFEYNSYYMNPPSPWNGNENIRTVIIEEGITSVGDHSFFGCSNLTNATIPQGVTYIGMGSFYYCGNLSGITIPDSVDFISNSAFSQCIGLKTITFMGKAPGIIEDAFLDNKGIQADVYMTKGCSAEEYFTQLSKSKDYDFTIHYLECPDGHQYGSWKVVTEPTCKEPGKKERKCTNCGNTQTETLPITSDHTWDTNYTVDIAPTYDAEGSESIHCSICDTMKPGSTRMIPKIQKPLDLLTVSGIENRIHNGKEQILDLVVIDGGTVLTEGTDYTVAYENNVNVGIATVTVTGIGHYTGTYTNTFPILPAASSKVTCTNVASGIKVSWVKVEGATSYYVYRDSKLLFRTSALEVTDKEIKYDTGTKFTYRVIASAKGVGNSTKSRTAKMFRLMPVGIKTLTNPSTGKMTVMYDKCSGCYGYVVRYGLNKDMSDANVITVKGENTLSRTFSGMKKGKTYYVQVRTYMLEYGVRYYSGYCTTKTITIKK